MILHLAGIAALAADPAPPGAPPGARPAGETAFILVAGRELAPGDVLETSDMYAVEIPVAFIPAGVIRTPSHAVGRVVRARMFPHEFVVDARLGVAVDRALPVGKHLVVLPDAVGWKRHPAAVLDLVRPSVRCVVAREASPTLPFWPDLVVSPEHLVATLTAIHDGDVEPVAAPSPLPDCP